MFGSTWTKERSYDEQEWRRRAARPATFIASRGGVDVGLAGVYEFDARWCVMGMWISPPARGTGIVQLLVESCEAVAREAGVDTIALWVMEDNPRGLRAYHRLGYQLTGEREHVRHGRHQLLMTKRLSTPAAGRRP
jgi:ribosomal protein S18 acetylase RimI-like enzyme